MRVVVPTQAYAAEPVPLARVTHVPEMPGQLTGLTPTEIIQALAGDGG